MKIRALHRGFTLIELLVVLGIIGILAAVLFSDFGAARQDAKNQIFRAEMKEVQLALETYKAAFGQYPPPPACTAHVGLPAPNGISTADSNTCGTVPVINGFIPEYIPALPNPADSDNANCHLIYQVDGDISDDSDGDGNSWDPEEGTWYKLTAERCYTPFDTDNSGTITASEGIQSDDVLARCPNISTCNLTIGNCDPSLPVYYESFAVYSLGGQCRP